jgi:hypothetical protein
MPTVQWVSCIKLMTKVQLISVCRSMKDLTYGSGSYCSRRQSVSSAMIFCHQHCFLITFLFKPPTSKHSYHCSIDQKTSIHTHKSSSSPRKFDEMCYLSLFYMLLSRRDLNFFVRSALFVAEHMQDVSFDIKACCYDHWLLQ